MFILRIKLSNKVFYNVDLGNSYIKVNVKSALIGLDPTIKDLVQSNQCYVDQYKPDILIFKDGIIDWDTVIYFGDYFETPPDFVKAWIMNSKGDIIESLIIRNIYECR